MESIQAQFQIVKVDEDHWDVLLFSNILIIKVMAEIYGSRLHVIENSKFNNLPLLVIPDFEKREHAVAWKDYWIKTFEFPEKACSTCPTVRQFFRRLEEEKSKVQNESQQHPNKVA